MWLALCDPDDAAGMWAAAGLRRMGMTPLEVVLPEELVTGSRISLRLGGDAAASAIRLRDGREIRGDLLRGVLNRITGMRPAYAARLRPGDRAYVVEEVQAFVAAWLSSLTCPVVNQPDPACLYGRWRATSEWRALAADARLDVVPYRSADRAGRAVPDDRSRRRVLVVGAEIFGERDAGVRADRCLALARATGTELLGLDFVRSADGASLFSSATPFPDLRLGGRPGLRALYRALGG